MTRDQSRQILLTNIRRLQKTISLVIKLAKEEWPPQEKEEGGPFSPKGDGVATVRVSSGKEDRDRHMSAGSSDLHKDGGDRPPQEEEDDPSSPKGDGSAPATIGDSNGKENRVRRMSTGSSGPRKASRDQRAAGAHELTRVEGECGVGAQHAGRWRENSGGAYRGVSPAGKEADEDGLAPLEEAI